VEGQREDAGSIAGAVALMALVLAVLGFVEAPFSSAVRDGAVRLVHLSPGGRDGTHDGPVPAVYLPQSDDVAVIRADWRRKALKRFGDFLEGQWRRFHEWQSEARHWAQVARERRLRQARLRRLQRSLAWQFWINRRRRVIEWRLRRLSRREPPRPQDAAERLRLERQLRMLAAMRRTMLRLRM
jgi:hypothetical protein